MPLTCINVLIIEKAKYYNRQEIIQRVQAGYLHGIVSGLNGKESKSLEKILDEFENPIQEVKPEDVYNRIEEVFKQKIER